jgi:hypothetical protein
VVVDPCGGEWGTITVSPFSSPSTRIQYLHCWQIDAQVGWPVAPWTMIGYTGDKAPDGSGITGIHSHIQVQEPGEGLECWQKRNFVDPATWPIADSMAGTWVFRNSGREGYMSWTLENRWRIPSSAVGANIVIEVDITHRHDSGCTWPLHAVWPNVRVTGHSERGIITETGVGTCQGAVACNYSLQCQAPNGIDRCDLIGPNDLLIGASTWHRSGRYAIGQTKLAPCVSHVDKIMIDLHSSSTVANMEAFKAIMAGVSKEQFYGTYKGEAF